MPLCLEPVGTGCSIFPPYYQTKNFYRRSSGRRGLTGARVWRTQRFTGRPPRVARVERDESGGASRRIAKLIRDFVELVIGPTQRLQPDARCHRNSGRTRWLIPGYRSALQALIRRPAAMAWAA